MEVTTRQISHAYWWLIIIRAVVAILFGIMALISAEFTLLFLVYLFGAYVLLDGILAIIISLQERRTSSRWWLMFLLGIVGIVVGLLSFIHPGNVALVIFYLVAAWLIIAGFFRIDFRHVKSHWYRVVVSSRWDDLNYCRYHLLAPSNFEHFVDCVVTRCVRAGVWRYSDCPSDSVKITSLCINY